MSGAPAPREGKGMTRTVLKENVLKYALLLNVVVSFLVLLFAIKVALGTGLLLGGIMFNLSLAAYILQRNGRVMLGLVGGDLTSSQS